MKVVILAGGLGTRLSEYTKKIPKPMVEISGKPILMHIIESYMRFGLDEFYIALGYKGDVIKDYFFRFANLSKSEIEKLRKQEIVDLKIFNPSIKITLVNTGELTLTGGRIKRLKDVIGKKSFMLTYGDGLSSVNINSLLSHHKESKKLVTVTAVHPIARFGELKIDKNNSVIAFKEKPQLQEGWINGGFFVLEPEIIDLIKDDNTVFEEEPLEKVATTGQFNAFKHEGFWYCMDTQRDKYYLEELVSQGNIPWMEVIIIF